MPKRAHFAVPRRHSSFPRSGSQLNRLLPWAEGILSPQSLRNNFNQIRSLSRSYPASAWSLPSPAVGPRSRIHESNPSGWHADHDERILRRPSTMPSRGDPVNGRAALTGNTRGTRRRHDSEIRISFVASAAIALLGAIKSFETEGPENKSRDALDSMPNVVHCALVNDASMCSRGTSPTISLFHRTHVGRFPPALPVNKILARHHHTSADAHSQKRKRFVGNSTRQRGSIFPTTTTPGAMSDWQISASQVSQPYGSSPAWTSMIALRQDGIDTLAADDASLERQEMLAAAVGSDERLEAVFQVAQELRSTLDYEWPDFYVNVLPFLLEGSDLSRALHWHDRLFAMYTPTAPSFAAMLSRFVCDPTPALQTTLAKIYNSANGMAVYDQVIASLFDQGNSEIARKWRKRFIAAGDVPLSTAARPFLKFLCEFYPTTRLTIAEAALLSSMDTPVTSKENILPVAGSKTLVSSDSIVAKWFASTWTSLDFAINLAQRVGIRAIGPLSLQALGLREMEANGFAARIVELNEIHISISPMTYCNLLIHLAGAGEQKLYETLLKCDVHPDEFEDPETIRMLHADAIRQGDLLRAQVMSEAARLLRLNAPHGANCNPLNACGSTSSRLIKPPPELSSQAHCAEATSLSPSYSDENSPNLVGPKPYTALLRDDDLTHAVEHLKEERACGMVIPTFAWRNALWNLGRLGRFDELESLSLYIVSLYKPPEGGLISLHTADAPRASEQAGQSSYLGSSCGNDQHNTSRDGLAAWQQLLCPNKGRNFPASAPHSVIPADLPMSHRQHPAQKIFHQSFQRRVVRWGFDRMLRISSLPSTSQAKLSFSKGDVACGVRILANLRDAGVCIDPQVIESTYISRILVAQIRGRLNGRWVDKHELSVPYLKRVLDQAWGFEVFSSENQMQRLMDERRRKEQARYSRMLLGSARKKLAT